MRSRSFSRRRYLKGAGAIGALALCDRFAPAYARAHGDSGAPALPGTPAGEGVISLQIAPLRFDVNGRRGHAIAVNGTVPGPLLRLREGQDAIIRVGNRLTETTSIHWHGLILPPAMDGVPGVSFAGIQPQSVFEYRFPVKQSGTYWAHSHSGGQELLGLYFPLIIDPIEPDPFPYDRDYVVMLSDWSFEAPEAIIAKLKKQPGYYNFQRRTLPDFVRDARREGLPATLAERWSWARMRMDPTDFADVTGYTYTYLLNGLTAEANWTGLFRPGERVRLRFIDAGAMTYFDVRVPGLKMTVVQAHGQNVRPIDVDELRIAPGETYDVIVEPGDRAYTVFAESLDRSGYARGTLAPRAGMTAAIPARRARPLRTMADMGMDMPGMKGMEGGMPVEGTQGTETGATAGHDGHGVDGSGKTPPGTGTDTSTKSEMSEMTMDAAMGGVKAVEGARMGPSLPGSPQVPHGPDRHGAGNSAVAMSERNRLDEPGSGFDEATGTVLVYADLQSVTPFYDQRQPERELELHITGNMERYMWSFDGKKYSEAKTPIPFRYGERLRLVLVNDTMMEHPIHLHGMWMVLENGHGANQPLLHTVSVKPAERLSVAITADAPGQWAMHCHLLLHMELGMFRVVEVSAASESRS